MSIENDNNQEETDTNTNSDTNSLDVGYFSFSKQDGYLFVRNKSRFKEDIQDTSIIKMEIISGIVFESHRVMLKLLIPLILIGVASIVCSVIHIRWKILLDNLELEIDTIPWNDLKVAIITLWTLFGVLFLVGFARDDYYSLRFAGGAVKLYDLSKQQHSNLCRFLNIHELPKDEENVKINQRDTTSKAP